MRRTRSTVFKRTIGSALILGLFVFGISTIIWLNQNNGHTSSNPYINISELPESFMENYLSEYAKVANIEDKQNMLIVTSLNPLENTYGAKTVIPAANNQYFLVFDSDDSKNLAYDQMSHIPELAVSKNSQRTLYGSDEEDDSFNSWGVQKMGLDYASELVENYPNKNDVVVAILDTGLNVSLFNENFGDKLAGTYNVTSGSENVRDDVGHGTHIAGTIAESTPSNVKIYSVKMTSSNSIYTSDIIAAIDYITYYKIADVMNMSFGGYHYEDAEYLAIEAAKENNIIAVAAAGNESTSERSFPSSFDNTISISAIDINKKFAEFSNFGSMVDFAAPGVDILSINGNMSGTSMATPHAVAAVAIAKSFKKDFTFNETIDFLRTRAEDLGAEGKDGRFGWGLIDYNGATLCANTSQTCDKYGIFEITSQVGIEIVDPVLTKYNYGSLTNILATTVKINYSNDESKTKRLGDLGYSAKITGYNPYASGEQNVTVEYNDFTASFKVTNPNNWESGWKYSTSTDYNGLALSEYRDHGLDIKTLYLPETIDGQPVKTSWSGCMFNGNTEWISTCEYPDSADSLNYETLVIPESFEKIGGFSGNVQKGILQNLYRIVSLNDDLKIGSNAFSDLGALVSFDGIVNFNKEEYGDGNGNSYYIYDGSVFAGDTSLVSVTLASDTTVIPRSSFSHCSSLESIDLPNSVTEIEDNAFYESGIRSMDLGDNVTKIGDYVFSRSNLEEITIPAATTEINKTAFSDVPSLGIIEIDSDNPVYDSREHSNAIIVSESNTLIIGTYNTVIPGSVKTIASNSFSNINMLSEIAIPEGVETIERWAFSYDYYLQKIELPKTLTTVYAESFYMPGIGTPSGAVYWIWNNTVAKDFVFANEYPYVLRDEIEEDPALIVDAAFEIVPEGRKLRAFDTFTPENFIIKVFYYDEETEKASEEPEIISDFEAIYNEGQTESLIGGYNSVTFKFNTATGYHGIKITLSTEAEYLDPEYEIPSGITAYSGQALSEIQLPTGFTWMNGNEFVDEEKTVYLGMFTPADALHYAIVKDIEIPVTVKVGTTFAEIFPDATLRACIVDNLNAQKSADYTEDNIDLNEVFAMTELNCIGELVTSSVNIENTRGIERMTSLKTLDFTDNSIERINLAKNSALEYLDLRGNEIEELSVENNPELSELLLDDSDVLVKTSAYLEMLYPDEDSNPQVIMNISKLKFLKDADFTTSISGTTYDNNSGIISFPTGGFDSFEVEISLDDGDSIEYSIYGFPRRFYITAYADNELVAKDMSLFFSYTNAVIDLKLLGEELMSFLGLSGYEVEETTVISGVGDDLVVGTNDVYLTYRFKKLSDDPDEPGLDPGSNPGTEPGTEPGDDEPGDGIDIPDNPQTSDNIAYAVAISAITIAALASIKLSFGRRFASIRNRR